MPSRSQNRHAEPNSDAFHCANKIVSCSMTVGLSLAARRTVSKEISANLVSSTTPSCWLDSGVPIRAFWHSALVHRMGEWPRSLFV